jgi:cytochrome c
MKLSTLVALTATTLLALHGARAAGADEILNKSGCMACHTKDRKLVGPSFKDIAAKYRGQDVLATLMGKVRKGGAGSFGPIPMSPNGADKISDAELKVAVQAILGS